LAPSSKTPDNCMGPIVQIRGLTYSYRRQQDRCALQGVDLEIGAGEFIAIAGRAGSGKSTLCYALNGLIPHSFGGRMEGEVMVCGLDTRKTSVPDLARHVGFVLQNAESQLVGLSVEEDTAFGLENIGLPGNEIAGRVHSALRTVRHGIFQGGRSNVLPSRPLWHFSRRCWCWTIPLRNWIRWASRN
jgi:energy-coupling factor transport system ATP-binding protein